MTTAFVPGFLLGMSLILAIGAQNAFVLRQGLRGEHVAVVCLVCALSDAVLISAGVAGFAAITQRLPGIVPVVRIAGAAFLFVYGARSLWTAWRDSGALAPSERAPAAFGGVLATTLALTWLNPHVYLDTVMLIGATASRFPDGRWAFGGGAVAASFVFFFALGYGARLLRPLFAKASVWRGFEVGVALVMWSIALTLVVE